MAVVIVVTGLTATGKTSLAERLAEDLRLPTFYKDDFKEALMDRVGWTRKKVLEQLGASSFELLFRVLEANLKAGVDCMVEANFRTEALPRFFNLRAQYDATLIEVHCWAEPQALVKRIKKRIKRGKRHPGHQDSKSLELGAEGLEEASEDHCLNLPDGCLRVKAIELADEDYAALVAELRGRLAGGS
jgi:predicted kinase